MSTKTKSSPIPAGWIPVIRRWLQETYNAEVVTFTADIGQGEEVEPAREKAKAMGVQEIYIEDLTEDFVANYVYPMFRANTVYEGEYLLGTSIARPLIIGVWWNCAGNRCRRWLMAPRARAMIRCASSLGLTRWILIFSDRALARVDLNPARR